MPTLEEKILRVLTGAEARWLEDYIDDVADAEYHRGLADGLEELKAEEYAAGYQAGQLHALRWLSKTLRDEIKKEEWK